ncbi:MAG: DUF721 domain-containing protein [Deltaproteobacteria bacterium]|nr:DUF721 domain-containing protein [Deltaproteobacteria bacterium]
MENIKLILDNLFRKRKLGSKIKSYQIFDIWKDAVGPRIARHSQPKKIRNRILGVVVDNSVWMQQLVFLEGQIKEKLNQMTGSPVVDKIRFQIGEINFLDKNDSKIPGTPDWHVVDIDDKVLKNIEKAVEILNDEEIKERLKNLFQKQARLESYREKE